MKPLAPRMGLFLILLAVIGILYRFMDRASVWQTTPKARHAGHHSRQSPHVFETASPTSPPIPILSAHQRIQCQVLRIYDGDTMGCDLNRNGHIDGSAEHVRLLGIDAPEMHYSVKNHTGQDQPMAREAKDFLAQATLHQWITLETDRKPYDRYHRVLAYVYHHPNDSVSVNEALVQSGDAVVWIIPPNKKLASELYAEQSQAKNSRSGVWALSELPVSHDSAYR